MSTSDSQPNWKASSLIKVDLMLRARPRGPAKDVVNEGGGKKKEKKPDDQA